MQLDNYDFILPEELIAQQPAVQRDASRLMCLDRARKQIELRQFTDLTEYFRPGDVLVLNDTQVIPARLLGQKETGGKVEIFLVRRDMQVTAAEEWLCLTKSSKAPRAGTHIQLSADLTAEVLGEDEAPYRRVRFHCNGDFMQRVEEVGHLPLPSPSGFAGFGSSS